MSPQGFELPVFVINLPASTNRRRNIAGRLRTLGIEPRFVPAIDGRRLTGDELARISRRGHRPRIHRALLPTEIGCTLSHKAAIEAFAATGAPYGLILEDDANPCVDAVDRMREILAAAPDFDLYKLGNQRTRDWPGVVRYRSDHLVLAEVYALSVRAHAYIISRDGAARILPRIVPIGAPFDEFLRDGHLHNLRACEVWPDLFALSADSGASTIVPDPDATSREPAPTVADAIRDLVHRPVHRLRRRMRRIRQFGIGDGLAGKRQVDPELIRSVPARSFL